MELLRPLLLDNVSSIQQAAALALGRLASYSADVAESIVSSQVLPQLIDSLPKQNVIFHTYYRDSIRKLQLLF